MKISLNWIKQYTSVDLEKDELIRRIGSQIGAIEEVEDWGSYFDEKIIIAEIESAASHKDADKLGVYKVRIGKDDTRTVVAGDKTLEAGDKVAYIPPGSVVPASIRAGEPMTIEERDIRGEKSQGMLGSAKELLVSDDHEGVLKLDTDAEAGSSYVETYELDDLIIDVENKMFTHRPDLFGILGIAREVAGVQDVEFKSPDWYTEAVDFASPAESLDLEVEIQIPELCPRFTALVFSDVEIKDSPQLMQSYLMRVGLRPINNVVDITNYAMHLTAQPSHAFDYDKIATLSDDKPKLIVRKPKSGEKIKLLDGREIEPHEDAALVATDRQAVSIGGSIGGTDTEVDKDTKTVILEAASWDLYSIRRTSYAHGIFTDAVTRFNKGQSPKQCLAALNYMVGMFGDNAEAKLASNVIDEYPVKTENSDIEVSSEFINKRLGSEFSAMEIAKVLNNVEIVSSSNGDEVSSKIPFWRTDLQLREDLVEEVGRLHGYDNLPVEVPPRLSKPNPRSFQLLNKSNIANALSAAGAHEVLTYNFVSSKLFSKAGYDKKLIDSAYRIRNSISPELEYMRISLLPSLIEKINPNIRSSHNSFGLFELNKSHNKEQVDSEGLPIENSSLALVVASDRDQNGSAYYQAKAYIDYLCKQLGLEVKYRNESDGDMSTPLGRSVRSLFAGKRTAAVEIGGKMSGFVGEFSAKTKANFKLPDYSAGFELDFNHLQPTHLDYKVLSRYPSSTQDVTLETPDGIEYEDLRNLLLRSFDKANYEVEISPVDIYRATDGDMRRITFRLVFQSLDRTLKTSEINQAISAMVSKTTDMGIKQV